MFANASVGVALFTTYGEVLRRLQSPDVFDLHSSFIAGAAGGLGISSFFL
jgi:hypothetical protein